MSLTEMVRAVVPSRDIAPASQGGEASSRVTRYVQRRVAGDSGGYADSTIATVAWRMMRETEAYRLLVMQLGASPAVWRIGDFVVTALKERNVSRFILLVLDPTLPRSQTLRNAQIDIDEVGADLNRAHAQWARRLRPQGDYGPLLAEAVRPELITEFALAQGLEVVVAPMPLDFEYTAERPTPPFDVQDASGAQDFSMGVYSDSRQHGPGLTSAAHGVTTGAKYDVFDGGNQIDTIQGVVTNSVLDSAFLRLSKVPHIPSPAGRTILSGVTPNTQLQHEFYGAQSGKTLASVSGWVDDLLTIEPWLQNRVFTGRILQQRDSGSALIDANDRVIGFAFYNSSTFANPSLSAWIWADSVRQDFQLT